MSETWQEFESECFNYLKEKYPDASFQAFGKSDSTRPDIYVVSSHEKTFYIETKSKNAQCGQFVLIPNTEKNKFDYSPRNHTPFFNSTQRIIDYMNENFSVFIKAGTSGKNIELNKELFYEWIEHYYSEKGVKFFITKSTDYLIFPIEKFSEYFDVSCCYRMKRSGSSTPGYSNIDEIKEILHQNNIEGELKFENRKLYLITENNIDGFKLKGTKYTYMFRFDRNTHYMIRKLSNTDNSNVIFRIFLKKSGQDKGDLLQFVNEI